MKPALDEAFDRLRRPLERAGIRTVDEALASPLYSIPLRNLARSIELHRRPPTDTAARRRLLWLHYGESA